MGCDIHSFCEVRRDGRWDVVGDVFPLDEWERSYFKKERDSAPFRGRNYAVFGVLAGVRNYSGLPVLSEPRGLPDDVSGVVSRASEQWDTDGHSHSWLTLAELLTIDRVAQVEDRRYTRQEGPNYFNGGATAAVGLGTMKTWQEALGDHFFAHIDAMRALGDPKDVRVVFWFDN